MSFWAAITNFLLNAPFWVIVAPDEAGIFLRGGRFKRVVKEGFYWKWPFYDIVTKTPIVEQVIDLKNQSVTTRDGVAVATSGAVKYLIEDVRKALLAVHDYDACLRTLALGVIADHIASVTWAECSKGDIEKDVQDSLGICSESWGIDVLDFWLTDYVEHKAYRIMADENQKPFVIGE